MWQKIGMVSLLIILQVILDVSMTHASFNSSTPVEIGFAYWRKPDSPQKFDAYVYGMEVAAKELNQTGGLAGHEIKIVPYDEQGKEEQSRTIAQTIATNSNMVAVVGFSNSSRAIKSIEPVSRAGIPILSSAGSFKVFDADPGEVFFSTNFGTKGEAKYFKAFATERNYRKAIFVYKEKDGYSAELQEEVGHFLLTKNVIYADDNQDDVIEFLHREITPDTVVLISLSVNENGQLAGKIRTSGVANDIYLGRGGMVGTEFFESGGRGLKNIYELSTLLAGLSNETLEDFAGKHAQYFNDEKKSSYLVYATYAYDMVRLLNTSVKTSGIDFVESPSELRSLISEGLRKVEYEGISDSYSFNKHRGINSFTSQYLLESSGSRAIPYKKQFVIRKGELQETPVAYMNIDILGVDVTSQEATTYDIEFILTITSLLDIELSDIDFENIVIGNSNFLPSINAKEFITKFDDILPTGMSSRSYKIYGKFGWDNSIQDFPFDTQEFGILMKPNDPIHKDFLVYFTNQDQERIIDRVEFTGWVPSYFKSGYKKGIYYFSSLGGNDLTMPYYRSSIVLTAKRLSLSPAFKFIFPLIIVLMATVSLFFIPASSNVDKLGSASNMLITVIALYFTYATIVDVNYITTLDFMYFGALAFVIVSKIALVMEYNYSEEMLGNGFIVHFKKMSKHYRYVWFLEIFIFFVMVAIALNKVFN